MHGWFFKRKIFLLVSLLSLVACTSAEKRRSLKSTKNKKSSKRGLSYDDLTVPQGRAFAASGRTPSLRRQRMAEEEGALECRRLLEEYLPVYMELAQKLGPLRDSVKPNSPARQILALSSSSCDFETSQANVARVFRQAMNAHDRKIGVILPVSSQEFTGGAQILEGMRKAFVSSATMFEDEVVVKDSLGNPTLLEQIIAQIVFNDQVAMIIGGATFEEAQVLSSWGERLHIPVIVLSSKFVPSEKDLYTFQVSPTQEVLAAKLAEVCEQKNFKRVGVLRPNDAGATTFTQALGNHLRERNLTLSQDVTFQRGNFESMEMAAKSLFRVRDSDRRGEFATLTRKMREDAKTKGYGFNPAMVMLPPEINFDVLFIPDNFKNVRHFVQIFKFLGVEKLQLMGNYEWRSKGLVIPYDPFLEEALFVDFIGSYANLPASLDVRTVGSPFFVTTDKARVYDYNLIGLHSMEIAQKALRDPASAERKMIPDILENMKQDDTRYFKAGNVFSDKRIAEWPAFIFEIKDKEIRLNAQLSGERGEEMSGL